MRASRSLGQPGTSPKSVEWGHKKELLNKGAFLINIKTHGVLWGFFFLPHCIFKG